MSKIQRNRYSKNFKKSTEKKSKKKIYFKTFAILGLVVFAAQQSIRWIKKSPPLFAFLNKSFITQTKKVDHPEVLSEEVNKNETSSSKKAVQLAKQVHAHRRFSEVTVSRSMMGQEYVYVRESMPVGIWLKKGRYVYVDGLGRELDEVFLRDQSLPLPIISGVGDLGQFETQHEIRLALDLIESMNGLFQISEVHWDPQWGWLVYGQQPKITVIVGQEMNEMKKNRLGQVLSKLRSNEDVVSTIDLDFNDRVVVRFRSEEVLNGKS